MKTILFPTDFSEASNEAFIYALNLASRTGAEVITLHAYQLPDIHGVHLPHTLGQVYESIELEEFEDYRDSIPVLREIAEKSGYGKVPIRNVLKQGDPIKVILKMVSEVDADLIVMGTKGAGWIREVFVGSVASEVLENATCPVLAVPTGIDSSKPIDRIAVTLELSENEESVVREALKFASYFDAKVSAIHVDVSHTQAYSQKLARFAQKFENDDQLSFTVLDGTDTLETIAEYVQSNDYHILVMNTHKRNFLEELWNYSMTKKMTRISHIPVLCLHES